MQEIPQNAESLFDLKRFIDEKQTEIKDLRERISLIRHSVDMLEEFNILLSNEDTNLLWHVIGWPRRLLAAQDFAADRIKSATRKFQEQLESDMEILVEVFLPLVVPSSRNIRVGT